MVRFERDEVYIKGYSVTDINASTAILNGTVSA
jgi:hypothetical protein